MFGRAQGVFGLSHAGGGGIERSRSAVELLPPLIEQFLGGIAPLEKITGAIQLLLRQCDLRLPLFPRRARFIDGSLRLQQQSLGPLERGFEVSRIHAGDGLAGMDHVALVDAQFRQAAGELGIDVDLVGFDAAVARDDARRQADLGLLPPIVSATGRSRTK